MKGQSAIEFVVLVGAVLFFSIVFISIIQSNISEKTREQGFIEIKELANQIRNEILLASSTTEGYYREFTIPNRIMGKEYSARIIQENIYLNTSDGKLAISIPVGNVTGQPIIGKNIIQRTNTGVLLN